MRSEHCKKILRGVYENFPDFDQNVLETTLFKKKKV